MRRVHNIRYRPLLIDTFLSRRDPSVIRDYLYQASWRVTVVRRPPQVVIALRRLEVAVAAGSRVLAARPGLSPPIIDPLMVVPVPASVSLESPLYCVT